MTWTAVIIQARMSSTRLPGKVMKPLGSRPVLEQVVRRVQQARIDEVVIATSTGSEDDILADWCERQSVTCYRGSLHDVLGRYHGAAVMVRAETVIRVTSDCPLYDPTLLNAMLEQFHGCDYLSNVVERRFPRGLDTEIFTFAALDKAFREAAEPAEREHVTPYIHRHPDRFRLKHYQTTTEDHSDHRWTLDTPEDYAMLQAVYQALGEACTTAEVLDYLRQHPDIRALNAHIEQKAH